MPQTLDQRPETLGQRDPDEHDPTAVQPITIRRTPQGEVADVYWSGRYAVSVLLNQRTPWVDRNGWLPTKEPSKGREW
jgi:hypothetical protein